MARNQKKSQIEELRKYLKGDISSLNDFASDLYNLDLDEEDFDYSELEDYASQAKDLADEILKNVQKIMELKD